MTAQIHSFPRSTAVAVTVLPLEARFSLRLRAASREAAEAALGLPLPDRIGRTSEQGGRRALCLGPDEWRLDVPAAEAAAVAGALEGGIPHALVEVTDREVTFLIEGPGSLDLLAIGIARDVRRLEVGRGARTVFDGVQAVLVREGEERFTLAVWRSYASHVEELLRQGAREIALGL
ncbi:sarcosine oxidase subunit gamma [Rubellimicrobium aerolatum]|uniref:Sarcosine oxidase subunit gamma n=1 Tax=Rubellimicrobium aerolatum TaxID=490979 RepID=A0ABW0SCF2_9RHOB|nr:sarcosine oxidase subunit gamma family protein [Rubellimicrobium aerolatum]MBP1806196.1 sarcosine oxidase subunit gamma [Rubellimicrobium aerolatum]